MKPNTIHKEFYTYTAKVQNLAAGGSATSIVNIESDSTFLWQTSTSFVTINGDPLTADSKIVPLIKISMLDSGSGRNIQSEPVFLDSISGDGGLPFILPVKRKFKANSNITVKFDNVSTATAYSNVELYLVGVKLFYGG